MLQHFKQCEFTEYSNITIYLKNSSLNLMLKTWSSTCLFTPRGPSVLLPRLAASASKSACLSVCLSLCLSVCLYMWPPTERYGARQLQPPPASSSDPLVGQHRNMSECHTSNWSHRIHPLNRATRPLQVSLRAPLFEVIGRVSQVSRDSHNSSLHPWMLEDVGHSELSETCSPTDELHGHEQPLAVLKCP